MFTGCVSVPKVLNHLRTGTRRTVRLISKHRWPVEASFYEPLALSNDRMLMLAIQPCTSTSLKEVMKWKGNGLLILYNAARSGKKVQQRSVTVLRTPGPTVIRYCIGQIHDGFLFNQALTCSKGNSCCCH